MCSLEKGSRVNPRHILDPQWGGEGFILSAVGDYLRGLCSDGIRDTFKMHSTPLRRGLEWRPVMNIQRATLSFSKLSQAPAHRLL